MIIPSVAAKAPETRLFFIDFSMELLDAIMPQYFVVKFPAAKIFFPIFRVNEVANTVINGNIITTKAKSPTRIVKGIRSFPRSTTSGLTDFPETVM